MTEEKVMCGCGKPNCDHLKANSDRFLGLAEVYDNSRPSIPPHIIETIISYLDRKPRVIIDIGCGTGLSTRPWVPYATEKVIGIEPNHEMLEQARKISNEPPFYKQAYAHETGLPDKCADIVTITQAFHWMDPTAVLAEVNRILAPGGVFAVVDVEWPPVIPGCWKSERAFEASRDKCDELLKERKLTPSVKKWSKREHMNSLRTKAPEGMFDWVREIRLHSEDMGTWKRLVHLLESQGGAKTALNGGVTREEGLVTALEDISREDMGPEPRKWMWCYTIEIGFKKK